MTDTPSTQPLDGFRRQIDTLDDQIISLINQRIAIVKQVGEYKRAHDMPGHCPIRPGREAKMLRRIAGSFKDSGFAAAGACQLWRTIIGTSTAAETELTVSVFAPEKERDLYWLAREYFGPAATYIRQPHAKRVIGDVLDGKASVGIVPTVAGNEGDPWWPSLLSSASDAPRLFAHLPFVYSENPKQFPAALAFARVAPEDSGDDVSLWAFDCNHDVSQHRLQTALGTANLSATWLHILNPSPNRRMHLIEIKGFVPPEHAGVASFFNSLAAEIEHHYFLGAYAVPFSVKEQE